MLYLTLLATAMLSSPALSYSVSRSDMWLTPLLGSLGGLLTVYMALFLYKKHPGKTLVQYSESILGPWLGKLVSLSFLLVCLQMNWNQLRQFAELKNLAFMVRTPTIIFAAS